MKNTMNVKKLLSALLALVMVIGIFPTTAFAEEDSFAISWESSLFDTFGFASEGYFSKDEIPGDSTVFKFINLNLSEYYDDNTGYVTLTYAQYMTKVEQYFAKHSDMKDYLIDKFVDISDTDDVTDDTVISYYSGGEGGGFKYELTSTYKAADGTYVLQGLYLVDYQYDDSYIAYDDYWYIDSPVELTLSSCVDGEWKILSYEKCGYYIQKSPEGCVLCTTDSSENASIFYPVTYASTEHTTFSFEGVYTFKNNDDIWYDYTKGADWSVKTDDGYVADVIADYFDRSTQTNVSENVGTSGTIKLDCAVNLYANEYAVYTIESDHATVKIDQGLKDFGNGIYGYEQTAAVVLSVKADDGYEVTSVKVGDYEAVYSSSFDCYQAFPSYKPGTIVVETKKTATHKSHTYKTTTTKATLTSDGKAVTACTACKAVSKTVIIPKVSTVKLSKASYTYDGKTKTPAVTVKDSKGNTLKKDTDYTVTYASGRKNTGKYAVTVTLKGNYSGSKTLYFNILPSKTSKISATLKTTSIKATWKAVTGATGYKVQIYKGSKLVKTVDTTKTNCTFTKLAKGTQYKITVTAYKTIDKKKVYSAVSKSLTTATKPGTPTLKVSAGSKKASLSWNKQACTGYEVYMSTKKTSGFKNVKTITKAATIKFTKTGLTKGKTYYFKVRAYKTVDGKKVYGDYSKVVSVKVK